MLAEQQCMCITVTHSCCQVVIPVIWVLPGLWQQAIVPVNVIGVIPQLALLGVLLDGGGGLILCAQAIVNSARHGGSIHILLTAMLTMRACKDTGVMHRLAGAADRH